jgi:membrane-associated phospholipid phosphatase
MNGSCHPARVRLVFCTLGLLLALGSIANSQTNNPTVKPDAQPQPSPKPTPSLEKQFFRNVLHDQVGIWTSPFHVSRDDTKFLVPLGLTTAALIATDRRSADELGENGGSESRVRWSLRVSRLGSIYTTGGIAGTFYLVGVAKHDSRARETGILSAEALLDAGIVSTVLKEVTQRPRPLVPDPKDDFFDGGLSFPSGHATDAWALATVIASEYHNHKAVQFTAYALASAVSLSRYTGRAHFLSDVLVGSAIGYGVGRYVYKKHHVPESERDSGQLKSTRLNAKWIPAVAPLYSRKDRTYGVALAWRN